MFIPKSKIAATILTAGMLAAAGVLTFHTFRATAAPAPAEREVPKEMRESLREAARKVYQDTFDEYKSGKEASAHELYGWSKRWLEAELAPSSRKAERIAALLAHLQRSREVERLAISVAKNPKGDRIAADEATCDRLEAEIRYCKEAGTVAPLARQAPPSAPAPATPEVLTQLWRQSRDTAQRIYEAKTKKVSFGRGMPSEFFGWSERWLDAELMLNEGKDWRIAALKAHLERIRETERLNNVYALAGQGMQSDADAATYQRIGADLRFFQETGEIPAPPLEMKIPKRGGRVEYLPARPAPKDIKELLQKRLEAAQNSYMRKSTILRLGVGQFSEIQGWSERWFEADLALRDKKADPIAALRAHLDRTREVERFALRLSKKAKGKPVDAEAAAYDRILADIRYFRATGKAPPPPEIKPPLPGEEPDGDY